NTIADCGISTKSHIVIYDDKNGANAAARLWWMLKAVGLENVQVLNGGIQSALKINFPTSSNIEKTTKVAALKITNWTLPMATIEEVEENSTKSNYIVIDVRETARYNGDIEPIDLVAGHIPSAINIPLAENLDENGLFLPPSILKEKYGKLADTTENVIIHCGSGVTACHTLLAFAYAGLKIPKLYVGSWSEWSRNNKPVATK
ncbi:MAG: sulfurtransferase, partial [Lutibacter sp.]|nr:sulfurtransferase [Lutibacter sp.]